MGPSCWDPFYYYDPFCYSYYDPFFYNHHNPYYAGWYGYGYGYRPYYPGYLYAHAPYYGGYWYDAPYTIRPRDGFYEPRGSTLGRGTLTTGLRGRGHAQRAQDGRCSGQGTRAGHRTARNDVIGPS